MGCCGDDKPREINENNKSKIDSAVEDSMKYAEELKNPSNDKESSTNTWLYGIIAVLVVIIIIVII